MQNKQKDSLHNRNAWKKLFAVFFCVLFLTFSPLTIHRAQAWDALPANIAVNLMNEIERMIRGMILNMLKQGAIQSINQQIDGAITGSSSSGALYISDWQDYLIDQPKTNSTQYLNDYLSQTTAGKGYSSSYKGEGFSSGQQSYYGKLVEKAKADNDETTVPQVTYEGDPDNMLTEGDPAYNMSLFLSGINNESAYRANARNVYAAKKEDEQQKALAKSIAYQGFIGTGETNGQGAITNPGILTKESKASAQSMGMMQITSASNPEEVVSAVVSQMISKMLSQGIGNAKRAVQKEYSDVTSKLNSQMTKAVNTSGPSALYK